MPRSNVSRSSRAHSMIEQPLHHHQGEDVSSEMLLADLMNSKKKQKPKLSSAVNAANTFLEDSNLAADTMSETGSSCSASTTSLTKDLTKTLRMSELELKILLEEFRNASNEEGLLEKENFFRVVKTTLSQKFDIQNSMPAFHRIYEAFDLDGNGAIDFVELATGLSTLLYGEEKDILRFVFGLIDVNNDGSVQQEEMIDFFRKFFIGQAKMNGYKLTAQRWKTLEDYLSRTFTSTDLDQNGTIEFDEFVQAVDDPDSPLGMLFLYFHSQH
ncbi:hypothetical protein C9374_008281 [Naegleria lovaniensis]|uniref:EF-hand domain-containing protein n=1 Tax=Naegleria lovaniensis TaxID=51637 RepID=A0AA88KFU5_NAELO|nr:uncharacterized protein C9374_008281 [Naegleria lovaniensis]KAG2378642.1 hypothetical protein C9374_008281 [Naegleria lovaniensis]